VTTPADLARPLSDDDWKVLIAALDEPGGHNIDVVAGLLTAVVTAPTPIMPSTWLPLVLGDYEIEGPEDPVLGLVLRMYNEISLGLIRFGGHLMKGGYDGFHEGQWDEEAAGAA
jgi:hypothetical protein